MDSVVTVRTQKLNVILPSIGGDMADQFVLPPAVSSVILPIPIDVMEHKNGRV